MFVYFGNSPTLVVSSAELAGEMFKTHDIVTSNRPKTTPANILLYECRDIGFANYGEYWRKVRKICVLELLSLRRVQSFQHIRDDEVSSLINKIRHLCFNKGRPLNLTEMLLTVSNNIVSRCVLGRKADEEEKNIGKSNKFGDVFPSFGWLDVLSGLIGRLNTTARALDALLDEVIEEHTNKAASESNDDDNQLDKKDFVDILLQLRKDGMLVAELSQDNLKAIILDMFVAGTDSTTTTLEWAMAELVKNPTSMKRAREEVRSVAKGKLNINMKEIEKMEYLKCVVKETLRLHPPAPLLLPREIAESLKWRGYDIPSKTRVIVNAYGQFKGIPKVGTSQKISFQTGQDFQFIPFGAGRRGCPGMSFALATVEYVIANFLYWFDWNLPLGEVEENLDMSEVKWASVEMALLSLLMKQLLQPFMDTSEIYNLPLFISFLLLILSLTLPRLLKTTRRSSDHLNLPPSPPKLPILGNLHQLLGILPHISLKALSERYGPLTFVSFGNSPTLVVSSVELASEMIKTHDTVFSNRAKTTAANILLHECRDIAFTNYGEYWRQHIRDDEVSSLINKICHSCFNKGGLLNLTEMLLAVSNNIVSRCVIGRKADEEEENIGKSNKYGELLRRLEEQLAAFCIGDMFPSLGWLDDLSGLIGRLNATARALDALLDQVIEEHINKVLSESADVDDQSDKKDFVDVLLHLWKDSMLGTELSQDNLKAIILDMFLGGTDTTVTTLEWARAELVKNPTSM
ncbi:hypothetical protein CUMW_148860, partial [Citrus unshiu]